MRVWVGNGVPSNSKELNRNQLKILQAYWRPCSFVKSQMGSIIFKCQLDGRYDRETDEIPLPESMLWGRYPLGSFLPFCKVSTTNVLMPRARPSEESRNLIPLHSLARRNRLGLPESPLESGSAREGGNPASRLLGPWSVTHNWSHNKHIWSSQACAKQSD